MDFKVGGNDHSSPMSEINVVPLVDIILVVLIIFMVTAPLVLKPAIDINLPQASTGEEIKTKTVDVVVSSSGEITLDGQSIGLDDLKNKIAEAVKNNPDTAAILTADRSVTLDKLTVIIDSIKLSGVKKVAFSVQKK